MPVSNKTKEKQTNNQQDLLQEALIQILHKHVGNLSRVLCRMHLGVTDELTTELSQLCHVDVPRQLDVSVQVKINYVLVMSIMHNGT